MDIFHEAAPAASANSSPDLQKDDLPERPRFHSLSRGIGWELRDVALCAARSAIRASSKTSSMAFCAFAHTGCAGHHAFLAQLLPATRQTFKITGPSMASITSRIEAWRPRSEISKPPVCPRREEISLARVRACSTFERKLSGAAVASASDSSDR